MTSAGIPAARVAVAAAALSVAPAVAQEGDQGGRDRVLEISRVDGPPSLEAYLAAAAGADAGRQASDGSRASSPATGVAVTGFRQRQPRDGAPASQPTTAYVSYDDDNLYVVFVCTDDPDAVRAAVSRREDLENDDVVGVSLDTFFDRKRAYLFFVNPLGVQRDGILTEGQDEDWSFDAVWESEGRMTPTGYVVRIAIPFRSLRFPNRPEQTWGIALSRVIRRNSEESYWPHLTKRVQGLVPQFAALEGIRRVSPGRNVQILPYGVLARARTLDPESGAYRTERDERPGLDAKIVLRDAITLDATVNPDFSQVESDDPQVTVNQRFEVFFPEKRPFFLENAGYFQTPIELFFSRRIADPGVGGRLTGKLGRWAVGAIGMNDRAPGRLPVGDPLAGRRAGIGALRLQREVGDESTVGAMVTDHEFAESHARAFSLDSRFKLGKNWAAAAQVATTSTRDPDEGGRSGSAALAELVREGRHLDYAGSYLRITPEFSAPLGFVRRVGIQRMKQSVQYKVRPRSDFLLAFGPTLKADYVWDVSGGLLDRELSAELQVELAGETEIKLVRSEAFELFEGARFFPDATELSVASEPVKWLTLDAAYRWGTAVNHDPAEGLEPFAGRSLEIEAGLGFRPTARLRLDNRYIESRLTSAGSPVFTERALRTRLGYQFTRALSLRAIVDYEAVVPDSTRSEEEHERRWTGDLLLTYLVSPGTALFLGYTDRYENLARVAGEPLTLRRSSSPEMSVGRQVYFKVSYLVRF
jgi:hypothetical protein